METKDHIQGLKNNMEGGLIQLICRIEYTKERINEADEGEAADLKVELDNYRDKLADLSEQHGKYLTYLEENEQALINLIEDEYEIGQD